MGPGQRFQPALAFRRLARRTDHRQYAARIRSYAAEIGNLARASPQDHMVEPQMLARTGLTLHRHLALTVANYLELKAIDPTLPVISVVQGSAPVDYGRCVTLYDRHGIDLRREPLLGVGSICRRQDSTDAEEIINLLCRLGVRRLHAYGVRTLALRRFADYVQ